jgi:hypothetical protein
MGAFETFVNANLGIRKPLILDFGPPTGSDKAAGIVGSEYVDTNNNFLYEKTGENNSTDWKFTRKLGDSLENFSSEISSDLSEDISILSGNINATGENLGNQIQQIAEEIGYSQGGSSISEQILQLSGSVQELHDESTSSRLDILSGVDHMSINYEDICSTSVFEGQPNVLIGLNSKSTYPPISYYSCMTYGISSTGFNVSFSSTIEEDNLFLDIVINGSPLSEGSVYAPIINSEDILSRTGDSEGSVFYGADNDSIYVFDGSTWQSFESI